MKNSVLQKKWEELSSHQVVKGFRSIRISSGCIADLFVGQNNEENRCLILSLPKEHNVDIQSIFKENLSIELFKDTNYIVLQLTDNTYFDLFDDLVLSLYHRIKDIAEVAEYAREFIQTFYKWDEFFDDKSHQLLSQDAIKGMFGELIVLKSFVNKAGSSRINEVLHSWKGPYDQGHDFVLDDKDIEVKTKDISKLEIRISSEYQLEKELDKKLELLVVSVETDPVDGTSIKDLIFEIKNDVIDRLGDCSILLKSINQKGLTFKNISEYDNYKFRPINQVKYDCTDDFPKLVKSNTPDALNNIKYNVRISLLNKFVISEESF